MILGVCKKISVASAMEYSRENLLNLLGLEATLLSIFGTKTRNFKTAAQALTQVENILVTNAFEIESRLTKSSCNKPILIFIKYNRNSSLPRKFRFWSNFWENFWNV